MKKKQLNIFLFTLLAIFYGITLENSCNAFTYETHTSGEASFVYPVFTSGDITKIINQLDLTSHYTEQGILTLTETINEQNRIYSTTRPADIYVDNIMWYTPKTNAYNAYSLCYTYANLEYRTLKWYPNIYLYYNTVTSQLPNNYAMSMNAKEWSQWVYSNNEITNVSTNNIETWYIAPNNLETVTRVGNTYVVTRTEENMLVQFSGETYEDPQPRLP